MDRDEALALLTGGEDGVQKWNEWRSKGKKETPDLRGANLSRAFLSEANLSEANLAGANLSGAFLSEANLAWAKLSGANLDGADLSAADVVEANLSEAKLNGANLIGAKLSEAKLNEANLSGANLAWANLSGAKSIGADLAWAKLAGANLTAANLSEANLTGADLIGAIVSRTNLLRATLDMTKIGSTLLIELDLSKVNGLETVEHLGPSSIATDTLYKSRGKIPDVFLRGCGVPEELIEYLPSLIASSGPISFYSCFISYSHADKSFARRLHDGLQGRGIRCWLDEHELVPGDDIYEKVAQGIRLWDKVLLCASKDSLASWWVEREIETAIDREKDLRQERGKQVLSIIPLNLDDSLFDWGGSHAATLRKRLAADFTGWESDNKKFEEQFERVVKALHADDTARREPPKPKL